MKKFLTVLLALSVVFTYTVGTAFAAATPAEAVAAKVLTEQTKMAEAVNDYAGTIIYDQKGKLATDPQSVGTDTNLTKTAIDYTVAQVIADYNGKIQTAGADALVGYTDQATADAAIVAGWADLDTAKKIAVAVFNAYAGTDGVLYTKAVADAKAAANAAIDAVDLSAYTDADAAALRTEATTQKEKIAAADNSAAGLGKVLAAQDDFADAVKGKSTVADTAKTLTDYKTAAKDAIDIKADSFKGTETTRLQGLINGADPTLAAKATVDLNNLDANIALVVAFYKAKIDAVVVTATTTNLVTEKAAVDTVKNNALAALAYPQFETELNNLAAIDLLVKYATDYAAQMKNMYDRTTGLAVYNAATVDKGLEAVTAEIKKTSTSLTTYTLVKAWMDNEANIKKAATEKADLAKEIVAGVEIITLNSLANASGNTVLDGLVGLYASTNWADDNKDAVEAIQKSYTKKIKAATTADEIIALVKEAQAAMDKYLTIAQAGTVMTDVLAQLKVLTYVDSLATVTNAVDGGDQGTLSKYADGVAAKDSANTYSTGIKAAAVNQAAKVLYDAVLAEQNAKLTPAQIKAILQNNYNAALAKIDAMKPTTALASEADAIVAAIKALPTTATLETKDQYLAVQKSLETYLENAGAKPGDVSNVSLLTAYMSRIVSLEKAAVEAAIRALPTTVTVADKAAVEAARAAVDAYDKAYGDYNGTPFAYGYAVVSNLSTLTTAETNLSNAMITDAAKKIAAIPETITAADKDVIDAARAAYDALSDEDKDVFNKALLDKLVAAEKQFEVINDEYLTNGVKNTKAKITSKSYKGKIVLKFSRTKGFKVDGYQLFKSTKKTSGFKSIGKTTKTSYTNTKNLVKGKRYYYKVRGYRVIGGKTVYTKFSGVVYRTAK
ncbi:hypothetical protein M2140_002144 [Clostridiales Family XIII bacterium PM5-7]